MAPSVTPFRLIDRWVPGDVPHHTRTRRYAGPDACAVRAIPSIRWVRTVLWGHDRGAVTTPANQQLASIPERTVDEEREGDEDDVDEDIEADRDETVRYRVS
jgi:hypothetical protein